jgi:hypothetical protein
MKRGGILVACIVAVAGLFAAPDGRASGGGTVAKHAKGTFEVRMAPQPPVASVGDASIGRFALDKQFLGDLTGTSRGEMLATRTAVDGSAGYVALERFDGTLAGRRGAFALQHSGQMDRGKPTLTITVVPDSGTGELSGIAGAMTIEIRGGKHFYALSFTLPERP